MSTAARVERFDPRHRDALASLAAEAFGLSHEEVVGGFGAPGTEVWLVWPGEGGDEIPAGYCRMVMNRETRARDRACIDALFVRPESRKGGYARHLLDAALAGAKENGMGGIWAYLPVSLPGRFVFLSGGRKVHDLRFLKHDSLEELAKSHPPTGYGIRAAALPGDAQYLADLFNDIFVNMWNFMRHTPETITAWYDAPDTRPENSLILEFFDTESDDPEGAGMAILAVDPSRLASGDKSVYIPDLGVVRAHRRRGLGRLLIQASAQRALACGAEALELIVSADDEGVRVFYQDLGFGEVGVISVYEWLCS